MKKAAKTDTAADTRSSTDSGTQAAALAPPLYGIGLIDGDVIQRAPPVPPTPVPATPGPLTPMPTPVVTTTSTPVTEEERKKKNLEDVATKSAEAVGKTFLDGLKASDAGKRLLAENERGFRGAAKAIEDFANTVAGKVVFGALGAAGTAGLAAAAWASRDTATVVSPPSAKSPTAEYAEPKFLGISLNWDFILSPSGLTVVTPWINTPEIPLGKGPPEKPTSYPLPSLGMPRPQAPNGPDPAPAVSDSIIYGAVMQNLMKIEQHISQQVAGVLAKQQGMQPGSSYQLGPIGQYQPPSLSFLPPLTPSAQPPTPAPAQPPAQKKSSEPGAERTRTGFGLPGPGGGVELPDSVRGSMEAAFGRDFASVRVHEGPHAQSIGARAYTRGSDIHFAPGQWQPGTHEGRQLLGHELAHVVQQSQGRVKATTQASGVAINDDEALEREADEAGSKAARGERAQLPGGAAGSANPRGV